MLGSDRIPGRFVPGIGVRSEMVSLFESSRLVSSGESAFDENCWRIEGAMPSSDAQWVTVLFDEPEKRPGLVLHTVACRVEENNGESAAVFARGESGGLAPMGMVTDPSGIACFARAYYYSLDPGLGKAGRWRITLTQVIRGNSSMFRRLVLADGHLHSSIEAALPEPQMERSMIAFADEYSDLPDSVPLLSAGDAVLRIAGRHPIAPWRVDNDSFEAAWAESFEPRP